MGSRQGAAKLLRITSMRIVLKTNTSTNCCDMPFLPINQKEYVYACSFGR